MFQALLDAPGMQPSDFSSLRFCISGGAPLSEQLKTVFEKVTGARVIEGYGLSESSGVVSTNPYAGLNKPGTIGQPIAGTRVRLVNKEDPSRPAPKGEPGEIVVAGPQIMKGYWNRPEADAAVFVTGKDGTRWLRTGDVGTIDEDGYIRIVDRLKDMIAVGGFKVFPSQIEEVLYRNPAVKEALVLGLPDAYHGELPHAYVTLNEGAGTDGPELTTWLNARLGKHERVAEVVVRDNLPKTMIGKLSRKDLLAEIRSAD
jgi:long-chain acyl-CoA synthetase